MLRIHYGYPSADSRYLASGVCAQNHAEFLPWPPENAAFAGVADFRGVRLATKLIGASGKCFSEGNRVGLMMVPIFVDTDNWQLFVVYD